MYFLSFKFFLVLIFLLFPCDLMTIFSITFGFLSLVHVSIIGFCFVATMNFIYNNIYIYVICIICMIILGCCFLKFRCILTTLHFYYPPQYLLFLTYFIFLSCLFLNHLIWIQMVLQLLSFNLPYSFISS